MNKLCIAFLTSALIVLLPLGEANALDQWFGAPTQNWNPFKKSVCTGASIQCTKRGMTVATVAEAANGVQCQSGALIQCHGQSASVPKRSNDPKKLSVLAWNVYAMPFNLSYRNAPRLTQIKDQLNGPDVVVLSELFQASAFDEIASKFPFHTEQNKGKGLLRGDGFLGSGVYVFSQWPFVGQPKFIRYGKDCAGSDCLADKGAVLVKIDKHGQIYNIIATHLEADENDRAVREKQLQKLKTELIEQQNIAANEPLIIAGDLNVNFVEEKGSEYSQMLRILDATHGAKTGFPFTYDSGINTLAEGPQLFLDYVLYSKAHKLPVSASLEAIRILPEAPYDDENVDLSDHLAVLAQFEF